MLNDESKDNFSNKRWFEKKIYVQMIKLYL